MIYRTIIWRIIFLRYFLIYVLSLDRWCDRKNHIGNPDGWIVTLMNSRCIDGNDKWCWVIDISDMKKKKLGKQTQRWEEFFLSPAGPRWSNKNWRFCLPFHRHQSSRSDQLLMERFNKCFLIYIRYTVRLEKFTLKRIKFVKGMNLFQCFLKNAKNFYITIYLFTHHILIM